MSQERLSESVMDSQGMFRDTQTCLDTLPSISKVVVQSSAASGGLLVYLNIRLCGVINLGPTYEREYPEHNDVNNRQKKQ